MVENDQPDFSTIDEDLEDVETDLTPAEIANLEREAKEATGDDEGVKRAAETAVKELADAVETSGLTTESIGRLLPKEQREALSKSREEHSNLVKQAEIFVGAMERMHKAGLAEGTKQLRITINALNRAIERMGGVVPQTEAGADKDKSREDEDKAAAKEAKKKQEEEEAKKKEEEEKKKQEEEAKKKAEEAAKAAEKPGQPAAEADKREFELPGAEKRKGIVLTEAAIDKLLATGPEMQKFERARALVEIKRRQIGGELSDLYEQRSKLIEAHPELTKQYQKWYKELMRRKPNEDKAEEFYQAAEKMIEGADESKLSAEGLSNKEKGKLKILVELKKLKAQEKILNQQWQEAARLIGGIDQTRQELREGLDAAVAGEEPAESAPTEEPLVAPEAIPPAPETTVPPGPLEAPVAPVPEPVAEEPEESVVEPEAPEEAVGAAAATITRAAEKRKSPWVKGKEGLAKTGERILASVKSLFAKKEEATPETYGPAVADKIEEAEPEETKPEKPKLKLVKKPEKPIELGPKGIEKFLTRLRGLKESLLASKLFTKKSPEIKQVEEIIKEETAALTHAEEHPAEESAILGEAAEEVLAKTEEHIILPGGEEAEASEEERQAALDILEDEDLISELVAKQEKYNTAMKKSAKILTESVAALADRDTSKRGETHQQILEAAKTIDEHEKIKEMVVDTLRLELLRLDNPTARREIYSIMGESGKKDFVPILIREAWRRDITPVEQSTIIFAINRISPEALTKNFPMMPDRVKNDPVVKEFMAGRGR